MDAQMVGRREKPSRRSVPPLQHDREPDGLILACFRWNDSTAHYNHNNQETLSRLAFATDSCTSTLALSFLYSIRHSLLLSPIPSLASYDRYDSLSYTLSLSHLINNAEYLSITLAERRGEDVYPIKNYIFSIHVLVLASLRQTLLPVDRSHTLDK